MTNKEQEAYVCKANWNQSLNFIYCLSPVLECTQRAIYLSLLLWRSGLLIDFFGDVLIKKITYFMQLKAWKSHGIFQRRLMMKLFEQRKS